MRYRYISRKAQTSILLHLLWYLSLVLFMMLAPLPVGGLSFVSYEVLNTPGRWRGPATSRGGVSERLRRAFTKPSIGRRITHDSLTRMLACPAAYPNPVTLGFLTNHDTNLKIIKQFISIFRYVADYSVSCPASPRCGNVSLSTFLTKIFLIYEYDDDCVSARGSVLRACCNSVLQLRQIGFIFANSHNERISRVVEIDEH